MPHLVLAIKNDNARVRTGAAHAMSSYPYIRSRTLQVNAIKSLVPALKDRDIEVRLRSAEGLLSLSAPQVKDTIPVLTACLSDDVPQRRERAASSLGQIGPTAAPAIPALPKLLKDTTFQVRVKSAIAITKIDPRHASKLLPVFKESILPNDSRISALQKKAIQAVQTLGESAALLGPTLISKLSEPKTRNNILLQLAAVKALAKVDEANAQIGVEKLIELLQDRGPISRYHGILAMRTLGELAWTAKPALPSLLDLINDESPAVAALAAVLSIKIDPMRANKARAFLRTSLTVTKPFKDLDHQQRTLIRESVEALEGEDNKGIAAVFLPELIVLLEDPQGNLTYGLEIAIAHATVDLQSSIVNLLGSLEPSATPAIPGFKRLVEGSGRSGKGKNFDRRIAVSSERAIQRITAEPTSKN
jgi:HEAT repeat protein